MFMSKPNTDVFITDELYQRPPKTSDRLQEDALQELARKMVDSPGEILPQLVDLAMEVCGAVSGGISLFEAEPDPGVFRWHFLRGELAAFDGATTPRNFSPCGITLDNAGPVLVQRPERTYTWLVEADVSLPECLLVPLYVGGDSPLGTLWMVSAAEGHFDPGHAKVLTQLAAFTGMAVGMWRAERRLQETLHQQEMLTKEMNHRVKNLFAITDSMIRFSARAAASPAEMAKVLSGRLNALADAHVLVQRSTDEAQGQRKRTRLDELVSKILLPHDRGPMLNGAARIIVKGPAVQLGDQATTGLALVFHELATNAAKYGSLSAEEGVVEVSWRIDGPDLKIDWIERYGPHIEGPPEKDGFGSVLSRGTIKGLGGGFDTDWRREGLAVCMSVSSEKLSR